MDKKYNKSLKILGLDYDADIDTIKKAYRELVKIHHPDLFKNPKNKEKASKNFKIIKKAYDYLIEKYISPENRVKVEDIYQYKQKFKTYEADVNSEFILFLKDCIKNKTRIFMWYKSGNFEHNITRRIIVPKELYLGSELNKNGFNPQYKFLNDKIYLIAFCELRQQQRTFRLDRILNAETYEEKLSLESEKQTKSEFSEKLGNFNKKTAKFADGNQRESQGNKLKDEKYGINYDLNCFKNNQHKSQKSYIHIFVTTLFLILLLLVLMKFVF